MEMCVSLRGQVQDAARVILPLHSHPQGQGARRRRAQTDGAATTAAAAPTPAATADGAATSDR